MSDVVHGFPKSTLRASGQGAARMEDGGWRMEGRASGILLCACPFSASFPVMAANKKLGCLSIFLFVALCASVMVNFILVVVAISRLSGGSRQEEATPRFRETIVWRGNNDKIAGITLRGLISSSLPGNVSD